MPSSAQPTGSPGDKSAKTRLEREIEEILEKSEREHPLPPPTPIRRSRARRPLREVGTRLQSADVRRLAGPLRQMLEGASIFLALILGIVAVLLGNLSPFLATIVAVAAVVALFWPVITRRGAPDPGEKMWRGRVIESRTASSDPLAQVRAWLRRRNLLK